MLFFVKKLWWKLSCIASEDAEPVLVDLQTPLLSAHSLHHVGVEHHLAGVEHEVVRSAPHGELHLADVGLDLQLLWKSTTVSSFPLRTSLLLLPVVVMMKVSNSGQLLFTSSLLPISCMMVASIVFLLMSL